VIKHEGKIEKQRKGNKNIRGDGQKKNLEDGSVDGNPIKQTNRCSGTGPSSENTETNCLIHHNAHSEVVSNQSSRNQAFLTDSVHQTLPPI